jgi:tetratricopeptide (TPR) repeat protein
MITENKRKFRRYTKETKLVLMVNDRKMIATAVDYSLAGVGAIVEGMEPMHTGEVIGLSIAEPEIKAVGKVVWSRTDNEKTRVGIRILGQLQGRIRDFGLSDTLIGLQMGEKTGILTVVSGDIRKKVYIRKGDMIFSSSNQDDDRVGRMLLKEGRISPEQHAYALEARNVSGERLCSLLVKLGYLAPQELTAVVRRHVEELILSLFVLEEGRFAFEERELPSDEVITLKLSAANLIYNGIKRVNDPERVMSKLPPGDSVIQFSPDPQALFQDIRLDEAGRRMLSCVDGHTSIQDILRLLPMDRLAACVTLYALLSTRIIEVKEEGPSHEMPENTREEMWEEKEEEKVDPRVKGMIEDIHKRYQDLGYYRILEIREYASPAEIKHAYYTAAKKFHPDLHFALEDDSLKMKLKEIFSYVCEAYATLSDPKKKREYDSTVNAGLARVTSKQDMAKAKCDEGKMYLKKRQYGDAELLFGQALYFDRDVADYHFHYGLALMGQKKIREAGKAFEEALTREPFNGEYLAEFGFACLELGFPERAKGLFEKTLRVSPSHARALEGLARIKA